MDWTAFFALLKQYPKTTLLGVAFIVSTTLGVGNWIWCAEESHAQAAKNEKTIEQLVEFQRAVVDEKEADLKAEKAVMDERTKLCLSGKLTDKELCATVGVAVE